MNGDASPGYGWISIALHWIAAALVIALFLLGEQIEDATTQTEARAAISLHASVGVTAWAFLAARVLWRLLRGPGPKVDQHWTLNLLAGIVQYGLILVISVQIITGPMTLWTVGAPLSAFGWFEIASPLKADRELHELFETIHALAANFVLPLIGLHVLGALKHLIIDRDGVFQRMLVPRR